MPPAAARPPLAPAKTSTSSSSIQVVYALHIFSGPGEMGSYKSGNTTLRAIVRDFSTRYGSKVRVEIVEFDHLNCNCSSSGGGAYCDNVKCCGNLLRDAVYSQLLCDCRRGKFIAIVAGIPCDGYW